MGRSRKSRRTPEAAEAQVEETDLVDLVARAVVEETMVQGGPHLHLQDQDQDQILGQDLKRAQLHQKGAVLYIKNTGKNAFYCMDREECPWRDFTKPPQDKKQ